MHKISCITTAAAVLSISLGALASETQKARQLYAPVPGGFEIRNGNAEFSRPLYGWHGDDREDNVRKSMTFTGDRPKVSLKVFTGRRIDKKSRGVLEFGDGTGDVVSRYVWGRAEYEIAGKGTVKMVRSASSDGLLVEVTGDIKPKYDGAWVLAARSERGGKTYYDFEREDMPKRNLADIASEFASATDRVERIARTIEIKTPYPILDSLLACQLVAADAMFEGRIICHGVTNWRMSYAGWRGPYVCLATGWSDRFKDNARLYFRAQRKNGRIPCQPNKDSIYNMNEVFVDSVLRYWLWSGDDAFMRECAYEGVKRHLAWMEKDMKVPGTDVFENYLNAWNTDDKWCNGGGGTIASSYVAYAYRVMTDAAKHFGKDSDAEYFAKRTEVVEKAIADSLWNEADGVWGEYRERFGLKRLVPHPDLSSVYTAIDSLPLDLERNRRAVCWVEDNIPSHFTSDGFAFLYSSDRLPLFYSSCGRYQNENFHWALACYQSGEAELGWRNFKSAMTPSFRGVTCGPGGTFYDLNFDLSALSGLDFSDSVATFLRTVTEGVFGIRYGREIEPSFPADWESAEIRSPWLSYSWTRKDGVKITGGVNAAKTRVKQANAPRFAGKSMPQPHNRWGNAKGEGSDCSVPTGLSARCVDLASSFNQNLRTLHKRKYSPRFKRSSIEANGRTGWERHETLRNRKWPKDYCVPKKLNWPADGLLKTKYGPSFRLGPAEGANAAFVSLYDQFPKEILIPLTGKASKIALLTAISTNPNVGWVEAAKCVVEYADGTTAALSLVPPDNCDDWLNYSQGQWSYYDRARDDRPYAAKGNPVMFGQTAHANVHALSLDPEKELRSLRFVCTGTQTLAGLLGITLY